MTGIRIGLLAVAWVMISPALPAHAQDSDALSRSDGISLSAGDSSRANIAIQTPTPWPRYLNDFDFDMPGQQGVDIMHNYLTKFGASAAAAGTTININTAK